MNYYIFSLKMDFFREQNIEDIIQHIQEQNQPHIVQQLILQHQQQLILLNQQEEIRRTRRRRRRH